MGEWQARRISYLRQYDTVCQLCGQLVPARVWVEDVEGRELEFCSPDHARRYVEYWLPRHRDTNEVP